MNVLADDAEESSESGSVGGNALSVLEYVATAQQEQARQDQDPTQDSQWGLELHVGHRPAGGLSVCDGAEGVIVAGLLAVGIGASVGVQVQIATPGVSQNSRGDIRRSKVSSPYPLATNVSHLTIVSAEGIDNVVEVGSVAVLVLELRNGKFSPGIATQSAGHAAGIVDNAVCVGNVVSKVVVGIVIAVDVGSVVVDVRILAEGLEQGIGTSVGEEGVDEISAGTGHHADVIFGNSIERKGNVGAKVLGASQIPLLVSIAAFTIVVVVVDGTFGPAVK